MSLYVFLNMIIAFLLITGTLLYYFFIKKRPFFNMVLFIAVISFIFILCNILNEYIRNFRIISLFISIIPIVLSILYLTFIFSKDYYNIMGKIESILSGKSDNIIALKEKGDIKELKILCNRFSVNYKNMLSNIGSFSNDLNEKMSQISEKLVNVKDAMNKQEDISNNFNTVIGILGNSIELGARGLDETRELFNRNFENFSNLFESIDTLSNQNITMHEENANMEKHSLAAIKFTIDLKDITKDGTHKLDNIISFIDTINVSVKNIIEMVTLIKKITAQTNLLAMNASIEAAHAGEKGHGFAVVANEIRSLAESSSEATEKITNIVNTIFVEVGKGQDFSKDAKNGIEEINEAFSKNIDYISSLADSINQQIKSVEKMKTNIEQIHDLSKEINDSSEYQQNRVQEIYETTETLNSQSLIINQLVVKQKMHIDNITNMLDVLNTTFDDSRKLVDSLTKLIEDNQNS